MVSVDDGFGNLILAVKQGQVFTLQTRWGLAAFRLVHILRKSVFLEATLPWAGRSTYRLSADDDVKVVADTEGRVWMRITVHMVEGTRARFRLEAPRDLKIELT